MIKKLWRIIILLLLIHCKINKQTNERPLPPPKKEDNKILLQPDLNQQPHGG